MFKIDISPRIESRTWFFAGIMAASILAGFIVIGTVFWFAGANPFVAIGTIFAGAFGSLYGLGETVTVAIPLILISAGLSLAFACNFWNIGAEGQLLMGAVCASGVALKFGSSLPFVVMLPLLFIAGFAGGAATGVFAGVLKNRFSVNEVISTLMINYIAAEFVQYLVYGPWKGASQFGFPYSDNFADSAVLPCLGATRIHYPTLVLGIVAALVGWVVLKKTVFGFEIRVMGDNPSAAKYCGINFNRNFLLVTALSGGLAGIAGAGEVAGIHHHLTYPWAISSGYGFTAIIAAWLARLNPLWCLLSSFLMAGVLVGGDTIQTSLNLPFAAVDLFNGTVLAFMIAGEFFMRYKINIRKIICAD